MWEFYYHVCHGEDSWLYSQLPRNERLSRLHRATLGGTEMHQEQREHGETMGRSPGCAFHGNKWVSRFRIGWFE